MKNRNTMQPIEYILSNLFWSANAMIWYRSIFFVALPGISLVHSKLILWIVVFATLVLGCRCTLKKRRNTVSVITNILLPYEVYSAWAYFVYIPKLVLVSLITSILVSMTFFVLAIMPYGDGVQKNGPSFRHRFKHGLLGIKTLSAVCMLILLVPLGFKLIFGHGLLGTDVPSVNDSSKADEWTVKNHIETVQLLKEEEWSALTSQQKLDVLGVVRNIEIRYLGLNHELYLKSGVLDQNVAAHYNHSNREIVIDMDHLQSASARELLNSLCHECYHSYQHQMIELYEATPTEYRDMLLFQYVDKYIDEFSDYNDGDENIEEYYYQTVELMARKYASESVEEYYELIEEYAGNDHIVMQSSDGAS